MVSCALRSCSIFLHPIFRSKLSWTLSSITIKKISMKIAWRRPDSTWRKRILLRILSGKNLWLQPDCVLGLSISSNGGLLVQCSHFYQSASWSLLPSELRVMMINFIFSFCHEKATETLHIGRIHIRLGIAFVYEFSVEFCFWLL